MRVPVYPDHRALWRACLRGTEPAESLPVEARERLFGFLATQGWTVQQIAEHCLTTEYTTRRVLRRMWLREWDEAVVAALDAALSTTTSERGAA